jgi:Helix-turn-helix domain
LATRQDRTRTAAKVPDLLTVEEAAAVLRIGRTKAYAMAREWRATGGRSGLPVKDFGNVLRVSRHALEELIGAPIEEIPTLDVEPGLVQPDVETPGKPAAMPHQLRRPNRAPSRARSNVPTRAVDVSEAQLPGQRTSSTCSSSLPAPDPMNMSLNNPSPEIDHTWAPCGAGTVTGCAGHSLDGGDQAC